MLLRYLNRVAQQTRVLNYSLTTSARFQHANKAAAQTTNLNQRTGNTTRQQQQSKQLETTTKTEKKSFAKMFKESKFVALGDMENKYLIGKIVEVLGDDLYIDYGGKFHCVCKRPSRRPEQYVRNANVKIKLLSFEMSSYFINTAKNITLLESDAILIDLYRPETKTPDEEESAEDRERREKMKKEIRELNSDPYY